MREIQEHEWKKADTSMFHNRYDTQTDIKAWQGLLFVVVMLLAYNSYRWYSAGVQAQVYQRNGVQVTQWEVYMGATPFPPLFQAEKKNK